MDHLPQLTGTVTDPRPLLERLAARVAEGDVGQAPDWGGADVVVLAESPPPRDESAFYPDPTFVITPHAPEVSWLFCDIRDVFMATPYYDHHLRYELFPRMADAAVTHIAESRSADEPRALLEAVIAEAVAVASQLVRWHRSARGPAYRPRAW